MRNEPDGHNAVTRLSSKERSGKALVVVFAAVVAGIALYFALGMPGMDHGTASSMPAMDMSASAGSHRRVGPAEFERLLRDRSATVINVHAPYAGKIDGTDLFLQFDNLDRSQLPQITRPPCWSIAAAATCRPSRRQRWSTGDTPTLSNSTAVCRHGPVPDVR